MEQTQVLLNNDEQTTGHLDTKDTDNSGAI